MNNSAVKGLLLGLVFFAVLTASALGGALADRLFVIKPLDAVVPRLSGGLVQNKLTQTVLSEESTVIDVAEKVAPAVVTVSITQEQQVMEPFFMDPFGMFGGQRFQGRTETVEQDIGSGFVVEGGLVVTNKHVVSNPQANFKVIDRDNNEYEVVNIFRDPANDLAILKVEDADLSVVELGDSDQLKVGQSVVAIGTALGEFRHTVTTGVISGLGRGIEAGDGFGGFVEELDNVIQTDAAINPGNSGGPLLNSAAQVVGINTAVSSQAENIGFAIPINILKESLNNFEETGRFERAFLGVSYQTISKETAILNDVPSGAYLREVVEGSSAADAGLQPGDIVTKINGQSLSDEGYSLAEVINRLMPGDKVALEYYRDGETKSVEVTLKTAEL